MDEKKRSLYEQAIAQCKAFEKKGKTMPYTSANGYMFSQLNKEGELGVRFGKEVQARYIEELNTGQFKSYGAVMRGYVRMPDSIWDNPDQLAALLQESYEYVMTLEPK
jgi:TfoX/Sxy family transcriptional regulator of competence genes